MESRRTNDAVNSTGYLASRRNRESWDDNTKFRDKPTKNSGHSLWGAYRSFSLHFFNRWSWQMILSDHNRYGARNPG
jgi:hypothetical protein